MDAHGRVSTVLLRGPDQQQPLPLNLSSPTVLAMDGADNTYAIENGYRVTRYALVMHQKAFILLVVVYDITNGSTC